MGGAPVRGKGYRCVYDSGAFHLCSLCAQVGLVLLCLLMQSPFFLPVAHCADEEPVNLLKNAGLEDGSDAQPAGWRVFTVPAEGVEALWDKNAHHSGKQSLMLHIETPYKDEVYNNWYQHVSPVTAGVKLLLSGYVRSKEVTEAAIWLQCWRDGSGEALRFATTSIAHPITGSVDWTRVETSIVPPPGTSFVTVRCVLAGKGTAWYDDLLLVPEREPDEPKPPEKTNAKPKGADTDTLNALLEAHKILLETNKSLAENASLMMDELAKIRDELNQLKLVVERWSRKEEAAAQAEPAVKMPEPGPDPPFRPATRKGKASSNSELSQ